MKISIQCRLLRVGVAMATSILVACSSDAPPCSEADGYVETEAGCLEYAYRYEPAEQLDENNVANPSNATLTELPELPPPPKSGFRLVLTPIELQPYEERTYCHSWKLPEYINKFVYTAEVHATPGLHHANLYGVDTDPEQGPQPYPACHPGSASFIGGGISETLNGTPLKDVPVPEVLFASSTQVQGSERLMFPDGHGFRVTKGEVTADVHVFNPTSEPLRVEVVYDFYTMPAELLTQELRAFMYMWTDFKLPAQSKKDLVAECDWFGGDVVAIMPHMHEWGVGFKVEFLDDRGEVIATPYDQSGSNLPESDIKLFEEPVDTWDASKVRFTCSYDNTTDHQMCHGIGENEMCFLFGFIGPPETQSFGIIPTEGAPCTSQPRNSAKIFDLDEYLSALDPSVRDRLVQLYTDPKYMGDSTCPDESPATYPEQD